MYIYVCMYLIACIFASPTKKNGFFFFFPLKLILYAISMYCKGW